jgi:hypothetical protein
MSRRQQVQVVAATAAALAVVWASLFVFAHDRWWNLVMAGLLLLALVIYLWRERTST